jgi:hypothetical protein
MERLEAVSRERADLVALGSVWGVPRAHLAHPGDGLAGPPTGIADDLATKTAYVADTGNGLIRTIRR